MLKNSKSHILLLSLIVGIYSCGLNKKSIEINNLNSNKIYVLGHRGMGKDYIYPGNTIQSISTAISLGADGSEIDVQVTKDSVLVIYHNKKLSTLTNYNGYVSDYKWSDLDSCVYITKNGDFFDVISVNELFNSISDIQNYYFSMDCKFNYGNVDTISYFNAFIYGINKVLIDYDMYGKIMVETGNRYFHQLLKDKSQVLQFVTGSDLNKSVMIAKELGLYGIGMGSSIKRADISMAHSTGLRVMTWAPKSRWSNFKAIRKSPDFIQTSKVKHMVESLAEVNLYMKRNDF